jgi:hypothetical protein
MSTIVIGQDAHLTVTVRQDGAGVPIGTSASITAALYTSDGRTHVDDLPAPDPAAAGADWSSGVVAVDVPSAVSSGLQPGNLILLLASDAFGVRRFSMQVESVTEPVASQLFVRDVVVDEIRNDRLTAAASLLDPDIVLTDGYLWSKVLAAEAEIARELRVPLVPTQYFPIEPTPAELAALPPGMPWAIDPGYDYDPGFFQGEKWGFLVTRFKPVHRVTRVRFVYPDQVQGMFDLPLDWIRMDAKYGHIRFVPATSTFAAPLSAFLMQALGGGRTIPLMIQLTYVAGLENVARDFPDLLDAIKKKAVLKVVQDRYLPQSGSISADGLSQSVSVQMDGYQDVIDHVLYGDKGTNGGLMAAIHGVRFGAMGGI